MKVETHLIPSNISLNTITSMVSCKQTICWKLVEKPGVNTLY